MEELKDAIDQLRVENSEYRSFIPQGPLCQLLARDKIENISRTIPSASQQMVQEDVITVVVSGARRIFAILIVCNHPEHIIDFIKALDQFQPSGLDHRLPFHIDTLRRILPNTRAEKFHKVQWEFSTPHLSTTGIPRCLEPQIVLPFTKNQRLAEGGFGVVYSVEINAEYHRLEISDSRKPLSSSGVTSLIRKELLPHAKDLDFEVELRNLSLLKLLKHPNIVRLLSCYTYRGTHNLVFPRASGGDLGELLLNDRPEAFKRNETFISALSGLASALHHVHHFVAEILDVDLIGCHHDLKPKNILVDGDCLLLADFGLSRFKLESDGSKTPYRQRNGYELAPECQDLDDEGETHEVSRASDIWSFGCILANMLIYMKEGPEGINSFKTARKFRHGRTTYYYFHCGDEPNEKMHAWLNKLEPSCTISERFLLQLVRKMLVLDPQARPDSGYVMASLQFATLHALSQPIQTRFRNLRDAISTSQAKTEILIEKQRFLSWQWALGLVDNEQRPIEELQFDSKFEQFDSIVSTLSMLQQVLDCFDISLGNPRRRLVLPSRQLNGSLLAFLDPMMQSRANNFLKIVLLDTEDLEYLGYLAQFGSVGGVRGLADTKRKTLRISSIDSLPSSPIDLANSQLLDDYQISMLLKGSSSRVYSISGDKVLFERGAWDDRFTHEIILQRIRDTTTLLTMIPSNPSIHILRCRGFCQQPDPGIIYDFPPNMQEPNAQIGTLRWFLDQRSRTSYPDLGSRFTLASRLASTVLAFHQASWLHKSLSASNITFFWLSGAPIASVLCEPYVLGFMHSRPDDANSFTESPVYSEEDKDYVHPDYLDNDERFEPLFDYYSLGLILFEIGMWRSLGKLTRKGTHPRLMLAKLMPDYMSNLQLNTGRVYAKCVETCLDGSLKCPPPSGEASQSTERRNASVHVNFALSVVSKLTRLASYEL